MAKDGLLPKKLGTASPHTHVPVTALVIQAIWIGVLTFTGSYDALTDCVMFASWIFYGSITASVFVLRKRLPNADRPYRTLGYPWVPLAFVVVTVGLLANTIATAPRASALGAGLVATGIPLYALATRRRTRVATVYDTIDR
jgi:APA family basic amino acid/polyamine antiporter